MIIIFQMAPQF